MFLASSLREVQGVAAVDGARLHLSRAGHASGSPGCSSERIQAELARGALQASSGGMNLDLTDEQRLIRETARDFADREIIPRARENDRNERFDLELVKQARRDGLPRRAGGRAVRRPRPRLHQLRAGRRGDRPRATPPRARWSRCRPRSSPARSSSGAPRSRSASLLPKLCSGEWLGCFGLTEPGTGSDAASVATRATRQNGGWTISGSKMFISLGNHAKVAMIFAQTDPEKKHRGMACFLVPTDSPGFTLAGDPRQARAARLRHRRAGARRGRGRRRRDPGRDRRRLQDRDVGARPRPLQRRRRLRRDRARAASTSRSSTRRSASSSTARSRASSSSRS